MTARCATCGEETGGVGTSFEGSVHKWGPTSHPFALFIPKGPKGLRRDLPVFVASAWWRDCDPFASVVALDPKVAEAQIEAAMVEAAEQAVDGEDPECHCSGSETGSEHIEECPSAETLDEARDRLLDGIAWSGVHPWGLREVFAGILGGGRAQDIKADLRAQGFAFMEVG